MPGKPGRRGFGHLRRLPSSRWQASYTGPDLARHNAPSTFDAKIDAEAWLVDEQRLIATSKWTSPNRRKAPAAILTLDAFAEDWLTHRDLKPRTRAGYRRLLDVHLLPHRRQ